MPATKYQALAAAYDLTSTIHEESCTKENSIRLRDGEGRLRHEGWSHLPPRIAGYSAVMSRSGPAKKFGSLNDQEETVIMRLTPAIFFGHGNPMNANGQNAYTDRLEPPRNTRIAERRDPQRRSY
jgi:hypothetical protein